MLFIRYMNKERGVSYPLCVQTPKLFLPAGIKEYKAEGGKMNINALCSMGREWESNPSMVAFRQLCDKIQAACVRLIMNKSLNFPYCQREEDVQRSFSPIVFISEKTSDDDPTKLVIYPPSFKLVVNTNSSARTLLVTRITTPDGQPAYGEIPYQSVTKGSWIVAMAQFSWVYRRKISNPNAWRYNAHISIFQGITDPPGTLGEPSPSCSGAAPRLAVIL